MDEQPLTFLRWAPATYAAIDKIREAEQEREQRKARTAEAARQPNIPRYGGR